MKYVIAHLISEPLKTYQKTLMKQLSRTFGVRDITKQIRPHLTIKEPFTTDDIDAVSPVIEEIALETKPIAYRVHRFSHFDDRLLYLDVEAPQEMIDVAECVKERLQSFDDISFSEFDGKDITYHATLCYAKNSLFSDIKSFLSKQEIPPFNMTFDNIAILQRTKKRWNIYRQFSLDHNNP